MNTGWELTLRGRLVAVLATLALCGAWMTGDRNACLAAAMLTAPLLVDLVWKLRGLAPLRVELSPRRAAAGTLFLETLALHNTARYRALHDLRIHEPRTRVRAGGGYVETLEPGRTARLDLPSRCLRRGRYELRSLRCESSYPLGLWLSYADLHYPTPLIIEPSRIELPAQLRQASDDNSEPSASPVRGHEEYYAMREYRLGEDARDVHALRSAAAGALVRKLHRGALPRTTALVLDLRRRPGHGTQHLGRRFEWGLSATATLVDQHRERGVGLTVFVLAEQPRVFHVDDADGADQLLKFLAEAGPSAYATLADDLFDELGDRGSCLWIAAGGYAAQRDRSALRSAIAVTHQGAEP